jgi:Domain of unknown function (DUF4437)
MTKLVPEAMIHTEAVEWRPWDASRKTPFEARGANGVPAWVKVLSKDRETGAESLMYRLDRGWSAASIHNTVYENLLVLDGEIEIDGQNLRKYAYSYRPEGYETGPVSTPTGVTIITFAGAPGEPASSVPVPHLDTEAMPWTTRPTTIPSARYYIKVLRADEETLDSFYLTRAVAGMEHPHVGSHDAPEEGYFLGGKFLFYDGVTGGRLIGPPGTYVHRGPNSPHGHLTILEDVTSYKRDYFIHGEGDGDADLLYGAFPRDTPAVQALREGRDPQLPRRW